jgi:hypothetical protein
MNKVRFAAEIMGGKTGERRRDMVIYSGTPVYRFNFWTGEEYYLQLGTGDGEIDIDRLTNAPLTLDHVRSVETTVGVFEKAWLEDGKLMGTARFAETPDVEDVWQKVEQGILRNVSVEASFGKVDKAKEKYEGLTMYRASKWTPEAVSLVAVGADRNAVLMANMDFDASAVREMMRAAAREELDSAGVAREIQEVRRELLGLKLRVARR